MEISTALLAIRLGKDFTLYSFYRYSERKHPWNWAVVYPICQSVCVSVCRSLCQSVCPESVLWQNGWLDLDAVWNGDRGQWRDGYIRRRSTCPKGKRQFWGGLAHVGFNGFEFWSPQLHQHVNLHSTCHLNNKTYPLTPDLHWHQYLHLCDLYWLLDSCNLYQLVTSSL